MKYLALQLALLLALGSILHSEEEHVCLAMVIQNDEATILRCLESAKLIADSVSICDMGSSDSTRELIEKFIKDNGISGRIHPREARNFYQNKVICAKAAQSTLKSLGADLEKSRILMLSPDQILGSNSILHKKSLEQDAYLILQKLSHLGCYSYTPNLHKASLSAEKIANLDCSNKWTCPLNKLRTLKVEDQTIGLLVESEPYEPQADTFKQQKATQAVEVFTQAIAENPDNPRYLLYLAQAYKTLKKYEQAIELYQTQIQKQGTPERILEEIWFSKYMIGECYEEMGVWTQALYWYLEAYQLDSGRGEPIKKIATHYRLFGQNDIAYLFAKQGLRIPYKENEILFPLPALYDYHFDEEISIAAFYTRYKEEGYAATSDLVLRRDAPYITKDQGYRNILFYTQNLKAHYEPIQFPLPPTRGSNGELYNPMNPSIFRTKDGYKLNLRAVNFTQMGAKHYYSPDPDGFFRTKNFLIEYDKNFKILSHHEIIEDLPREKTYSPFIVEGLEDNRIFELGKDLYFLATTFDTGSTGAIQVSLCKVNNEGVPNGFPVNVESLLPLQGPDPYRHEKNWLPFIKDNELLIVYNSDPFTIYKPNIKTGESTTILEYTPKYDFSRFRGSAAPISFDDGYLMLVHEVVMLSDNSRVYLHRFIYLDHDFMIQKVSRPFTFLHQGIEFCISMTVDHSGTKLILPLGIEDHEAYLAFVDMDEVRAQLHPLPATYPPF